MERSLNPKPKCRISVPPNGDTCTNDATCKIVWSDGEKTPACDECAMRTQQIAQSHNTSVSVDKR